MASAKIASTRQLALYSGLAALLGAAIGFGADQGKDEQRLESVEAKAEKNKAAIEINKEEIKGLQLNRVADSKDIEYIRESLKEIKRALGVKD